MGSRRTARRATPPALDITITWRPRRDWQARPLLRRTAAHVAAAEGFRSGQLSVIVLGRRAMATLHQRFMQNATATDVITFDFGSDPSTGTLDGEIYICADVAAQAARRALRPAARRPTDAAVRRAARHELALYLTHGLLHLAGYDDHDPPTYRRMHAREDELLEEIGIGPVFRTSGD